MGNKSSIKSRGSAIAVLKRLFLKSPDEDSVDIATAFESAGRGLKNSEKNKSWLSNKLPTLKYHNLLNVVYSYDSGRRKLDRLKLTLDGKKALGRIEEIDGSPSKPTSGAEANSITDLMNLVSQLQKKYPEFEITFDVKLKVSKE